MDPSMTRIHLVILCWTLCWTVVGCQSSDFDWYKFTKDDYPEHDCSTGPGPYANPYYPNRFYNCTQHDGSGRYYYSVENSCIRGECNNPSATMSKPCGTEFCNGQLIPEDTERKCYLRKSAGPKDMGGPFPHPTDPTRYFYCRRLYPDDVWEFHFEIRCGYGECATGIEPLTTAPYVAVPACGPCDVNKTMATRQKPRFPEVSAAYKLVDDVMFPVSPISASKATLWPAHTIPYYIDESLEKLKPNIYTAMADFHQKTCIRFRPWVPADQEYIYLFMGNGCYSFVGLQTNGQQLSLNTASCRPTVGVILQHLNHALGFSHEHTRSDRDQYLDILWDNITPGYAQSFDKSNNILTDNFTTDTIMMHSSLFGFKDGVSPTMLDKSGKGRLPNVEESTSMSVFDARRINAFYECPRT